MNKLRVSRNRRFLVNEDGTPFLYLGDTVWELFHRYTYADAETYLRDRAAKRFSVVQAVVLAEFSGLTEPNPQGHIPLIDLDPKKPNEAYFQASPASREVPKVNFSNPAASAPQGTAQPAPVH